MSSTQEKSNTVSFDKNNPYLAELKINYKLNKEGSIKDTRHISIDLGDSGIEYIPGDALYIVPENDKTLVEELLSLLDLELGLDEEKKRFQEEVNITRPSNKLYKLLIEKLSLTEEAKDLAEKYNGYNTFDIIYELKASKPELKITTGELVENSSKLLGRAYSIASSLRAHPGLVELCISRVEEEINGKKVLGVCSNYISDRVALNEPKVKIYNHTNDKFRLPEDKTTDIIMVGPGTGIAPFRAFIEERNADREAGEKVGQDWLFFGDQRAAFDYLYQDELEAARDKYALKIDTAFSRDQEHKVYVQDKMRENAQDIFDKLEAGAYFYVCGDARRMAKDVDQALRDIVSERGKDADEYIKALKDQKRYCRDVY